MKAMPQDLLTEMVELTDRLSVLLVESGTFRDKPVTEEHSGLDIIQAVGDTASDPEARKEAAVKLAEKLDATVNLVEFREWMDEYEANPVARELRLLKSSLRQLNLYLKRNA